MFIKKAYASGGDGYTRKAIAQAIDSGMTPAQARREVRGNVAHQNNAQRLRKTKRQNNVTRLRRTTNYNG